MAGSNHDWFTRNREDPPMPSDSSGPEPAATDATEARPLQPDQGSAQDSGWAPESAPQHAASRDPASQDPASQNPASQNPAQPGQHGTEASLATHVTSRASDLPDQPPVLGGGRAGDYTRVQPQAYQDDPFTGGAPTPAPPEQSPYGEPPQYLEPQYGDSRQAWAPGEDQPAAPVRDVPPPMPAPPTVHRARESQPLSHPSAAYPPAAHPSAAYPPASNTSARPPAPPQRQAPLTPPPGYLDPPPEQPVQQGPPPQSLSIQGFGPGDTHPVLGPPTHGAPQQGPPPEEPDAPPPRNRNRLFLILTAAVLAVVLVVFLAIRYGAPEEPPPPPSSTVRTYLEAIGRSDAAAAKAQLTEVPADNILLAQEALASSQKQAPLRLTSVTDGTGGQVLVEYTLGDEPMKTVFNTAAQPDGSYRVDGLVQVDLPAFGKLPLLVNGVDMAGRGKVPAFPGRYTLSTGLPFIDYDKPALTVSGPDRAAQTSATPVITPQGDKALRDASRAKLDECLRSHELAPRGCVLQANTPPDVPLIPESVTWKVSNSPFTEPKPRLGYGNPTRVEFDTFFDSRVELRFERAPDQVRGNDHTFKVRVTADLGGREAPKDLTFTER